MQPVLFRHDSSREHDTGAHPERIARIVAIEHALDERGWLGWDVRESPAVEHDALLAVHPEDYVERIAAVSAAGGGALDIDTIVSEGSYRAGVHAAGGAMAVVDALLGGEAARTASVHRPPGHHALAARAMGFCLFNNAAVGRGGRSIAGTRAGCWSSIGTCTTATGRTTSSTATPTCST